MVSDRLRICRLPAHDGEFWTDVVEDDRRYVEWLISGEGPALSGELYDYLTELLEEAEE